MELQIVSVRNNAHKKQLEAEQTIYTLQKELQRMNGLYEESINNFRNLEENAAKLKTGRNQEFRVVEDYLAEAKRNLGNTQEELGGVLRVKRNLEDTLAKVQNDSGL